MFRVLWVGVNQGGSKAVPSSGFNVDLLPDKVAKNAELQTRNTER